MNSNIEESLVKAQDTIELKHKSPSQLKRDNKRRHEFLAKKLESQPAAQENEAVEGKIEKVFLEEPNDEISLDVCEKLYIVANDEIDDHNIGIAYTITEKLEAKGLKVKKTLVERKGDQIRGEFIRCEVSIEPKDVKYIEKTNFEIDKCWVLPCT